MLGFEDSAVNCKIFTEKKKQRGTHRKKAKERANTYGITLELMATIP